jgi:hypothetical protein
VQLTCCDVCDWLYSAVTAHAIQTVAAIRFSWGRNISTLLCMHIFCRFPRIEAVLIEVVNPCCLGHGH